MDDDDGNNRGTMMVDREWDKHSQEDTAHPKSYATERFKHLLKEGEVRSIEEFLSVSSIELPQRFQLLELIAIESSHRRACGEEPNPADYSRRFPQIPAAELSSVVTSGEGYLQTQHFDGPDRSALVDRTAGDTAPTFDSTIAGPTPSVSPEDGQVPEEIGRYRVLELLGAGAMGRVYLARDPSLDRLVALKVPRKKLTDELDVSAYMSEAKQLAALDHPHIVPVFDAGEEADGSCFVVSKYVPGKNLQDFADGRPLDAKEAARIVASIAEALQHAHALGIYHRDVKPANILIDETGKAVLADFGLAITEQSQGFRRGEMAGTPAYMAPEQVRRESEFLDGRADIWALGVVLYQMLCGKRPFSSRGAALYEEIQHRPARSPRVYQPEIAVELEKIVLKCLEKKPADRYATAADLAADLHRFLRPQPAGRKWSLAVALVAAIVAITLVSYRIPQPAGSRRNQTLVAQQQELRDMIGELRAAMKPSREPSPLSPQSDAQLQSLIQDVQGLKKSMASPSPPQGSDGSSTSDEDADVDIQTLLPDVEAPKRWPDPFRNAWREIESARSSGDTEREYSLLLAASNALIDEGHFDLAQFVGRRMVDVAGQDLSKLPIATGQLGLAMYKAGNVDGAVPIMTYGLRKYYEIYQRLSALPDTESVQGYRSNMARMIGIQLLRIGNALKEGGSYDRAEEIYEEADEMLRAHNRRRELILLSYGRGGLERLRGNDEAAVNYLSEGIELARELNILDSHGGLFVNLANAHSDAGRLDEALDAYEQAAGRIEPDASYSERATLYINWSLALIENDDQRAAVQRLRELKQFARQDDSHAQRALEFLHPLEQQLDQTGGGP